MDVTCPFGSQAFDKASQNFVYKPEGNRLVLVCASLFNKGF